jgi:hypothetical protein
VRTTDHIRSYPQKLSDFSSTWNLLQKRKMCIATTPQRRPSFSAMSGLIESVIGGIPVGTETVKVVWFYVAASSLTS